MKKYSYSTDICVIVRKFLKLDTCGLFCLFGHNCGTHIEHNCGQKLGKPLTI